MCRLIALTLAAAILNAAAHAQAPSPSSPPSTPSPVLHSSAPLVVVDVTVDDQSGRPVHGLKPENFRLTDSNVPQTLSHVEEHSSQSPTNPAPTLAPLPPGTFTNYTPLASGSALNILLLDALNTPAKDRNFIRYQLQQYVKQANPNTRIAIFGLANRLILLQGFTSNPATLRDVVEHKLIARSASILASPGGTSADQQRLSDLATQPSAIDLAANLRQFEAGMGAMETELRAQYTLDAFDTLAHYLAAFPGRKNLLWFSGSFPLNVLPDPSHAYPSDIANTDQDELHETLNLLSRAQVAVYPIDARALMTQPKSDATTSDPAYANAERTRSQSAGHAIADALASATGGRAVDTANTLADAVTHAIDAGANYYTLTYTLTTPKDDDSYHPIHIETTGPDAAQPVQLFYRRGYYTYTSAPSPNPSDTTAADGRAAAYKQAAMSRGAPTPEDLLFKVRVLPASITTETSVAPNNQLSPNVAPDGPFRRYDLDYLVLPSQFTFTQQLDGDRVAKLEFLAYVFDTEGRLLDVSGTDVSLEPTTMTTSAKLAHTTIQYHLQVSVPDRAETFLRIAIRDVSTNKFGVIEVPTSTLNNLPPSPSSTAPASARPAGRSTPPQD
jgi:VWFA-related protein